jgi:hypothetical protein
MRQCNILDSVSSTHKAIALDSSVTEVASSVVGCEPGNRGCGLPDSTFPLSV